MRTPILLAAAFCGLSLTACGQSSSDKLAERVKDTADAKADALENKADTLENNADALDKQAEQIRTNGEQRAAAIDAADRNVGKMTKEERDAIVANKAAAVR